MMEWTVFLVGLAMALFAVVSGIREVSLYRRYVTGETQYLVSRKRRNRRLLISLVLLLEAVLLFIGFFILNFESPIASLLFWIPPLMLIVLLVYLSVLDFRETSRDMDHIVREACEVILRNAQKNAAVDKPN